MIHLLQLWIAPIVIVIVAIPVSLLTMAIASLFRGLINYFLAKREIKKEVNKQLYRK